MQNYISPEQWRELTLWLNGKNAQIPEFLRGQSNSMIDKIAFSMNSVVNTSIRRILHLQGFIEKAEQELYSEEALLNYEPETIATMYKEANKNLNELLTFVRQYTYQNKEMLTKTDSDTDQVRDILMSIPKEKLDLIVSLLQGE